MEQQRTTAAVKKMKVLRKTSHPIGFERRAIPSGKYAAFGLCTILAICAAGCTVGPRYGKPVTAVQPFHNAPSIESRQAVLPVPQLDTWWTERSCPVEATVGFCEPRDSYLRSQICSWFSRRERAAWSYSNRSCSQERLFRSRGSSHCCDH
jgi:hypothetical protein